MIHIIRAPATPQQIEEMQQALDTYIKLAVDVKRGILAGGGVMHATVNPSCSKMAVSRKIFGAPIGIPPADR